MSNPTVEQVRRTGRVLNGCVWAVAVAVMVFSLGTAFQLLREHDVPAHIAWMLAPAVDAALVAALVGDRALHGVGVRVGWGTVLRYTTGLMTLGLNVGRAVSVGDWGGVAIHAIAPVLLIVLTEAAQAYQLAFAEAAKRTAAASAPVPQVNAGTVPVSSTTVALASSPSPRPVLSAGQNVSASPHPLRQDRPRQMTGNKPRPVSSPEHRSRAVPDVSDLQEPGRKAVAAIEAKGGRLTRDTLVEQLRADGVQISTGRATELLRQLRDQLVSA